jgi:hypothetical protein
VTPLRRAQPGLPASFAPVGKARALGAQRGVITVTGIDDGGVAVDVEHPGGHVLEQLSEVAGLPGLADAAGEPAGSLKGNMTYAAGLIDVAVARQTAPQDSGRIIIMDISNYR